jgi:formylglycine-generating enzyme
MRRAMTMCTGRTRRRALAGAWFCLLAWVITSVAAVAGEMITIPGGAGRMGSDTGMPDERPAHGIEVQSFRLDRSPVTVADFAAFIRATGHETDAERLEGGAVMSFGTGQWRLVPGATWRTPYGPQGPEAQVDHPVTQVSHSDAEAYCRWRDKRLPTEKEWEFAARAGQDGEPVYAFGDRLLREGEYLANVWTGIFPVLNTAEDGFKTTSPVGAFGTTPIGLTDMAGNVWEWTSSPYGPYGADTPQADDPAAPRVQRGGSYLCDPKLCHGFRVSARGHATPDSAHMHVGFRCAADVLN